jgi:5'-nucleotidase
LVAYYTPGKELKDLLEVETTVANLKKDAHLQFSGVRFSYNPNRIPFDRVTTVTIRNAHGVYEPLRPEKLYRMVDYVRNASHGLLSVTPRDRQGRPVTDTKEGIVDADALKPGIQEIKEWVALTDYLKEFPDTNGNGIPEIPERYRGPEGRFQAVPSWNPIDLVAGGNAITWGVVAMGLAAIVLAFIVIRAVFRWISPSKKGRGRPASCGR